ncbi:MAG TPA: DUF2231 domain-containing protein [Thermoanaerobaculia bacterium]
MTDWILSATELPNLHPAFVHFPLALLPVAIGFDVVALVGWLRRRPLVEGATAALYTLAALGAWAAVWAGEEAEDSLAGLTPPVEALIEDHEEWAHRFLYTVAAVAIARLAVFWWSRRGTKAGQGAILAARALVLAGALAALGLLLGTADRGGGLVFRAGVAVMAVPAEEGEAPAPAPARAEAAPRVPE